MFFPHKFRYLFLFIVGTVPLYSLWMSMKLGYSYPNYLCSFSKVPVSYILVLTANGIYSEFSSIEPSVVTESAEICLGSVFACWTLCVDTFKSIVNMWFLAQINCVRLNKMLNKFIMKLHYRIWGLIVNDMVVFVHIVLYFYSNSACDQPLSPFGLWVLRPVYRAGERVKGHIEYQSTHWQYIYVA